MTISELQNLYGEHPNMKGLASVLGNDSIKTIYLGGGHGSCLSLFFSAYIRKHPSVYVFILNDNEEAGYFYHDMVQANGDDDILFFPSSYRRAIKYGQKDAANEILRTEVLSRLEKKEGVTVVTYPEALAEKGFDTIIPVVICNTEEFEHVTPLTGEVNEGDPILKLGQKK